MPLIDYRVGTASWTDPTLLATDYYPPGCATAEARLRFYASRFNIVEVDSTYYALPSERNAALWAARTPDDFDFNIKAFAWLTHHEAEVRALPRAIRERLDAEQLKRPKIPAPSPEARRLAFEMFRAALEPLRAARKLGCLVFQYPPWFTASDANRDEILRARAACMGDRLAIEFRHPSWLGTHAEGTFDFLAAHDLIFVGVDAPQAPSIPPSLCRSTTDIAYVRLHGRNRDAWFRRAASAADRFKYLYSLAELRACAAQIRSLTAVKTVYVVFNNCYADYGVRNAGMMRGLLSEPPSP